MKTKKAYKLNLQQIQQIRMALNTRLELIKDLNQGKDLWGDDIEIIQGLLKSIDYLTIVTIKEYK